MDTFTLFTLQTSPMSVADNIKLLREEKGLMQKEIASEIGLKPAHYNKIEKGLVEPSIDTLDKLAAYYAITIDDIVHYKKGVPKVVSLEDKTAAEQLRLISQLSEKDRGIIISLIDTMLTKQKFQDFFQQNITVVK